MTVSLTCVPEALTSAINRRLVGGLTVSCGLVGAAVANRAPCSKSFRTRTGAGALRAAGTALGAPTAAPVAGGAAPEAFSGSDANGTRAPVADAIAPVFAATFATAAAPAVASGTAARH